MTPSISPRSVLLFPPTVVRFKGICIKEQWQALLAGNGMKGRSLIKQGYYITATKKYD